MPPPLLALAWPVRPVIRAVRGVTLVLSPRARLSALERAPFANGAAGTAASSGLSLEWVAIGGLIMMNGLLLAVVLVFMRRGGRA